MENTQKSIPINLYRISSPLAVEVIENRRLTAESRGRKNDVRHLVFKFNGSYPCIPGQSAGILPPGIDSRTKRPNSPRLYSVASPSTGDHGDGKTFSLCVTRHFWENPQTGEKDLPGAASNYLCDLRVGDKVKVTGPTGKHFLLPGDFGVRDFIFVATGTGIAPFRGMLIDLFQQGYERNVWLILGVPYKDCLLYDDEFRAFAVKYPKFTYLTAISREENNPFSSEVQTRQNKMYVQVRMYEYREKLLKILSGSNSMMYLCGLKGMEEGIFPVLNALGKGAGIGDSFAEKLKADQRLRVEVY
ncbi:MAG: ferredoxin--NADP(+) reductase [Elusimicrobia bacterium]|nr:ferredoxin--NADP(+) reductase [Elusimicrobiota bacterium]